MGMGILEGPAFCHAAVHSAKHAGVSGPLVNSRFSNVRHFPSGSWVSKVKLQSRNRVNSLPFKPSGRRGLAVHCSFSSSSDGNGSMAGKFNENDEDFVNSTVIEAVEVRSGSDGFMIKMRDGKHLKCIHNHPHGGSLPDYAPHPAIILKMEDGSDLLLPIIVLEMPSVLLMAAMRNVQIARPTIYQVIKDMIEKMGYEVQLVRVTKRVNEAYFAQLYLAKVGNEREAIGFDLRPSDAINMAVRCKVPIQVNKHLAYTDGMRVVESPKLVVQTHHSDGMLFAELDRPDGQPCIEAKEFNLVRNMLIAAIEERYKDAAQWRDKLYQLRSKKKNWA